MDRTGEGERETAGEDDYSVTTDKTVNNFRGEKYKTMMMIKQRYDEDN